MTFEEENRVREELAFGLSLFMHDCLCLLGLNLM